MRNVTTQLYRLAELPEEIQVVARGELLQAWVDGKPVPQDDAEFMADGRIWK